MRSLIVTVAGTATRFNRDTGEETLKCLYHIGSVRNTLLYQILDKARDFDEFVIVGGYLFDRLSKYVEEELEEFSERIMLVYNPEYATCGSGYSLMLGINSCSRHAEQIVFVEGDLYYDSEDFARVVSSRRNVITINREPITARKAVVVYERLNHLVRYLYDTTHSYLSIGEPFLAIYNSGQIWKFIDTARLRAVVENLTPDQVRGTNLEIIQGYFGDLGAGNYEIVDFSTWHNCNTVADYNTVYSKIKK